jgi:outer membrane biosynthesis protein TonB
MAKKQSRRSVSLSRSTYERLRMYCETNQVSMSQFVEGRIGDFLGPGQQLKSASAAVPQVKRPEVVAPVAAVPAPAPAVVATPAPAPAPRPAPVPAPVPVAEAKAPAPRPAPAPMPAPAPAPVRVVQSAPNPGQKAAPAKPVKLDEAAAKRAADRIFTF